MGKVILYVHGTGGRDPAYSATCELIEQRIAKWTFKVSLKRCPWGDAVGAKLSKGGASIPDYNTARAGAVSPEDSLASLWTILLRDPDFELRMLVDLGTPAPGVVANQEHPADALLRNFNELPKHTVLTTCLTELGLLPAIEPVTALRDVVREINQSTGYKASAKSKQRGTPEHRLALARSLVATLQKAALEGGIPLLDKMSRDDLLGLIKQALGDDTRGVGSWLLKPLGGVIANIATSRVRAKRGALSDSVYPFAGDVLLYQARGERVRQYIRDRIDELKDDEVVLLAHSLGGIACVELQRQQRSANVSRLITFGSQAALLHEIGALSTLEPDSSLPEDFPPWSNFYDLNDPLSYIAAGVFPDHAIDYPVESGESFPASHSAYLHNAPFWTQLEALLRDA